MSASLKVNDPGLFATIQDLGRRDCLKFGVPHGGALDQVSLRLANLLVGNDPGAGALELLYAGPELEVCGCPVRVACVAASARLEIQSTDGAWYTVATGESHLCAPGSRIRCRTLPGCLPAYVAVSGGFDVPLAFGSRSTFVRGALGGIGGRALRSGDVLSLCEPLERASMLETRCDCPGLGGGPFRVLLGPQADYFSARARDLFFSADYAVVEADRMALRLLGQEIAHSRGFNITSDATTHGAIQIAGDGQPIVLSVDCQTTGGYPKLGVVISADLPALGRLARGTHIRFTPVTLDEAIEARREMLAKLKTLATEPRKPAPVQLCDALLAENLISGVYYAAEAA